MIADRTWEGFPLRQEINYASLKISPNCKKSGQEFGESKVVKACREEKEKKRDNSMDTQSIFLKYTAYY